MKNNSIPLQQSKDVMTYPPLIDLAQISIAESLGAKTVMYWYK
jgi:hypothetical protein